MYPLIDLAKGALGLSVAEPRGQHKHCYMSSLVFKQISHSNAT